MFSEMNPGLGYKSSSLVMRFAVYPVSSRNSRCAPCRKFSPSSLRPATSSHKYCFAAWRYWRISRIRPSGKTGSTTTDPGCTTTLRVTFNPPGSITESRRIVKILLLKMVLLETTRAERFVVDTQYPQIANCKKWSTMSNDSTAPAASREGGRAAPHNPLPRLRSAHILVAGDLSVHEHCYR